MKNRGEELNVPKAKKYGKYADLADRYFLHFVQRCSGFRDPVWKTIWSLSAWRPGMAGSDHVPAVHIN